jgi:hypothetical protein
MYAGVLVIAGVLDGLPLWLRLMTEVAAGAFFYVAIVLLLWSLRGAPSGPERELLERLRRMLARR